MNTFHLKSSIESSSRYVYFSPSISERLFSFLCDEESASLNFLSHIKGTAQAGITKGNFSRSDYFSALGVGPLFSKKFMEKFILISREISFFPVSVSIEGEDNTLYLAKINKRLDLVDSLHPAMNPSDDQIKDVVFRTVFDSDFYIARQSDTVNRHVIAVSEKFVDFCRSNKFKIRFRPTYTG